MGLRSAGLAAAGEHVGTFRRHAVDLRKVYLRSAGPTMAGSHHSAVRRRDATSTHLEAAAAGEDVEGLHSQAIDLTWTELLTARPSLSE
jgi:hypothetical protein